MLNFISQDEILARLMRRLTYAKSSLGHVALHGGAKTKADHWYAVGMATDYNFGGEAGTSLTGWLNMRLPTRAAHEEVEAMLETACKTLAVPYRKMDSYREVDRG